MPFTKGHKINVGRKFQPEAIQKMSVARKKNPTQFWLGKKRPDIGIFGPKNHAWIDGRSSNLKYRNWIKNKRNRLKRVISGSHTFKEWELLKEIYHHICPMCGKPEPEIKLTEDHIIPVSKGGTDDIDNIQPLCGSCNSKKNSAYIYFPPPIKETKN